MIKLLFLTFQCSISHLLAHGLNVNSIGAIDGTLSSATTPSQSEPGSNAYEGVLRIPKSSKTGASRSDCFMSYPKHLLGESYPSAVMQSVYSTPPADCTTPFLKMGRLQPFVHFSIVLCLLFLLHNRRSMLSNFLVFQTSGLFCLDLQLFCFNFS